MTRVIPKSEDERKMIAHAIEHNLLFESLDSSQLNVIIDAMERLEFKEGDFLIRQGEDGDTFYLLLEGSCDCFLNQADGPPKLVKQYEPGESFGELALMYNVARQASIKASSPTVCWGLDRQTYRMELMASTMRKRSQHEDFLAAVPLLSSLDRYARSKIADSLTTTSYEDGQFIITAGDTTCKKFFMLTDGKAVATKVLVEGSSPVEVCTYAPGGFFGELALIHDEPRAANVIAVGPCVVAWLERDAFVRLLGPVQELLQGHNEKYASIDAKLKSDSNTE